MQYITANAWRNKRFVLHTDDFMLSDGEVVAHHTADVSAETVSHALDGVGGGALGREEGVELRRTLGHQTSVAQRRQVTREESQNFPVDGENVVVASMQVRWDTEKHATVVII